MLESLAWQSSESWLNVKVFLLARSVSNEETQMRCYGISAATTTTSIGHYVFAAKVTWNKIVIFQKSNAIGQHIEILVVFFHILVFFFHTVQREPITVISMYFRLDGQNKAAHKNNLSVPKWQTKMAQSSPYQCNFYHCYEYTPMDANSI